LATLDPANEMTAGSWWSIALISHPRRLVVNAD
jgi:hypothetical protein